MVDYKTIRSMLPKGGHPETAARMAGSVMSLYEAQELGIDISDLLDENSGVPGTGVEEPKDEYTHVGVRMPSKPKKPADVRPQYGYDSEGTMVGWVQAIVFPSRGEAPEARYGAHISQEVKYAGNRIFPSGTKQVFDTEAEAKKFVGDGESMKWVRPNTVDPWESMSVNQRARAGKALAEDIHRGTLVGGRYENYVSKITKE